MLFLFFCYAKVRHIIVIVFLFVHLANWDCNFSWTHASKCKVGSHLVEGGPQQSIEIPWVRRPVRSHWVPQKELWWSRGSLTHGSGEQGPFGDRWQCTTGLSWLRGGCPRAGPCWSLSRWEKPPANLTSCWAGRRWTSRPLWTVFSQEALQGAVWSFWGF